jgi:hypothetical protein
VIAELGKEPPGLFMEVLLCMYYTILLLCLSELYDLIAFAIIRLLMICTKDSH